MYRTGQKLTGKAFESAPGFIDALLYEITLVPFSIYC